MRPKWPQNRPLGPPGGPLGLSWGPLGCQARFFIDFKAQNGSPKSHIFQKKRQKNTKKQNTCSTLSPERSLAPKNLKNLPKINEKISLKIAPNQRGRKRPTMQKTSHLSIEINVFQGFHASKNDKKTSQNAPRSLKSKNNPL